VQRKLILEIAGPAAGLRLAGTVRPLATE
jgi:hypothetical protein